MRRSRCFKYLLGIVLGLTVLMGCGQKGPLYLPDKASHQESKQ